MNYVRHTQCQKSGNKPAPGTVPSLPVSNPGTKPSEFLSEKATQIYLFIYFLPRTLAQMRNVKNDLVLKQIAGLIFIYLFIYLGK